MGVANFARFITCHEGTQLNRVRIFFGFFLNFSKFITEWTLCLTGKSKHLICIFFVLLCIKLLSDS